MTTSNSEMRPTEPCTDLCEDCNERPITGLDARCDSCRDNANERAYERQQSECFRGGEYAGWLASEQEKARRLK